MLLEESDLEVRGLNFIDIPAADQFRQWLLLSLLLLLFCCCCMFGGAQKIIAGSLLRTCAQALIINQHTVNHLRHENVRDALRNNRCRQLVNLALLTTYSFRRANIWRFRAQAGLPTRSRATKCGT